MVRSSSKRNSRYFKPMKKSGKKTELGNLDSLLYTIYKEYAIEFKQFRPKSLNEHKKSTTTRTTASNTHIHSKLCMAQ